MGVWIIANASSHTVAFEGDDTAGIQRVAQMDHIASSVHDGDVPQRVEDLDAVRFGVGRLTDL